MVEEELHPVLRLLKNCIDMQQVPFTERGSRLMVYGINGSLAIRLAERWIKRDHRLSAYRQRPSLIEDWVFTDENGTLLPVERVSFPHCVECRSPLGTFTLTYLDTETLMLILPRARCGLRFLVHVDQSQVDRRGGALHLTGDIRRNVAYTTNAPILYNSIEQADAELQRVTLIVDGAQAGDGRQAALLLNITPRLGFNRYIPDPTEALAAAAARWMDWFDAAPSVEPDLQERYYFAWWVMRAGLISTRFHITREAMTPSKNYYVGVWQWDAYFHALAYRYIDMRLAQDQVRLLLDHQQPNGMIPDAVHDEGIVTHLNFPVDADVTKPPLVAWAAWKLYQFTPDTEFLNEIYAALVRWDRWWFELNDLDHNGLCEYQHPFSSGLDDSPLWDEGMPVEAPDLNTYLCLQHESLAHIAHAIGEEQDARRWEASAQALAQRMLQEMWDPQQGLFWARRLGRRIDVRTPFNLFPLITGRMPPEVNARLVGHLTDPRQFWSLYPVPTVAMDDLHYNPDQMWRGPSWLNVNYLLIEGLQRCGYAPLAQELRRKTLDMVLSQDDIFEYYNPETGAAPQRAAPFFGWSSAIFIDLAIQASREGKV